MFCNETCLRVRYAETDAMGIVHHSNYPVWFEVGRTELLKTTDFTYSQMEEMGIMMPLINLSCSFKAPAKYDDEISINTSIIELTKTRVVFSYEVFRKSDQHFLCTGQTEHVFTNIDLKPINLKKTFPNVYDLLTSLLVN